MSQSLQRRQFLKYAAIGATAAALSPRSWGQVAGANSDIRLAFIGFNGRGRSLIGEAQKLKGQRITALCDVDENVLNKEAAKHEGAAKFTDLRKVFDSKDVDAVVIATPNHWHSLAAIWAIQAGKDVYVEKPVSHNIWEGRRLVQVARASDRMVQTGTQSRSSIEGIKQAVAWVQAGNLGKILFAQGLCYKNRPSIGKTSGDQKVPATLNYDLWSGPREVVAPRRNSPKNGPVHYDWHWIWNYGNGDLGNQGIHQMDIARWFLGEKALAPRVWSAGARLGYVDDGETPNTQAIFLGYEKAPLLFEVRGLPSKTGSKEMDNIHGADVGVVIHCEGGYVVVPDYTQATAHDKDGKKIQSWKGTTSHMGNWLEAIRSRKASGLHGEIEEGHLSAGLCHQGNISQRLGQAGDAKEAMERFKADKPGAEAIGRMVEHFAANGVQVAQSPLTFGPSLAFDPVKETFPGNAVANAQLKGSYRAPFVIPGA